MHCEKKRRRRTQRIENKKRSCFFWLVRVSSLMNLQIQKDEGGQENVIEGRKQW